MDQRKIRVLLGKGTMDAHDRGVRYLATKLREAGMEVIFMNFLEAKDVLDAAIFGPSRAPVRHVMVAGAWRVRDGRHPREESVLARFRDAVAANTLRAS